MPLTPLTEGELDLILPWRNAPEVRRNMYTQHEISPAEHRAWFERMRRTPPGAGTSTVTPWRAGRRGLFHRVDPAQTTAFWGFYARPWARPGTGTRMEYEALDLAFGELDFASSIARYWPAIRRRQPAQERRIHQGGIFRAQHFDGTQHVDVIRLGLLASEWRSNAHDCAAHHPTRYLGRATG